MSKGVYDALQKAEEERRRRTAEPPSPTPVEWAPAPASAPAARPPIWKRWLGRRGGAGPAAGAEDVNRRRFAILRPDSQVAEQFRTLRGRIDALSQQRPIRTLAMTSANPGEGKSTAAVNLAAVNAMSVGRQTLLVDCDLRRPTVHQALMVEPRAGLMEVLMDQATLDDALVKVDGLNLHVLAVRGQPANPSELLGSTRMAQLIEEISSRFDRAILDTPAALGLPDAKAVADLSDGMVMVVRAGVTPKEDVEAALDVLDRRRLLGLVLNGSEGQRSGSGYY